MEYTPHDYQKYITDKIVRTKKIMIVAEMGLGKSVATLTALDELLYNAFCSKRVLVIAPLRVADSTWDAEAYKWDHLKHIQLSKVLGSAEQRRKALETKADVYLINRENTKWLIDYYVSQKKWPFDVIVIDESSSFKNNRSIRFKALRKAAGITERVILLTGTPSPNGLMDLWPQVYLLDQGERLGKTITAYRNTFFNPGRRNRQVVFDYVPKSGAEKEIYRKISDISVSLTAADHLKMPDRVDNIVSLKMPESIYSKYLEMEREAILELEKEVVTAGSKAVVTNKLLQICNGAVYGEDRKVSEVHSIKLDALEEIVESNAGKPVMVFYNYQHDYDRLMQRFKKHNPGTLKSGEDINAWNAGKISLLLAHPASMGHGLNLQAGGNVIVWFGLNWSLELYLQANARLYRQGQRDTVIIHHLVIDNTVDGDVMNALAGKRVNQDELIEAIKARQTRYSAVGKV